MGTYSYRSKGYQAGGQAGITKSLDAGSKVSGTPAIPLTQYHRQALKLKKIIKGKGNWIWMKILVKKQ